MRRTVLLLAALLLAGCGSVEATPIEPAQPAEAQRAELGWSENLIAPEKGQLVFEVASLAVTADGWSAEVAVSNRTTYRFDVDTGPSGYSFGLMLLPTGDQKTVERLNREGLLPAIRRARMIEPPPPTVLRPGATWRGTLSAPGSLADGSWVRVVFGTFYGRGDVPVELERVVWFTDRTYRL